jgi:hypothetical protein
MKKEIIKSVLVITVVGFLCSLLLYFVYETTKPLIQNIMGGNYYER